MSFQGTAAKRRAEISRARTMALRHVGWAGGRAHPLDIRAGDTVEVIAGKDRGKRGTVERVILERQRIVVQGVNLMKRHTKARVANNVQGGIVDFNGPIPYSNVQLVCNRCDKATRIRHEIAEDGRRVMICRKCGERYERATA
ncbi:MAG TPA: 50S ribosomal protein L24 [Candidatus Binatia bacterium]|nr:50S ribosomal protein L24 [Candidatus Binatia bacterium]